MRTPEHYEDLVPVPRAAVSLPVSLPLPDGFDPERPETWPHVAGRLEFVQGRLLYMPPTGDEQQDTCADVVGVLMSWRKQRPEFLVAANEAGIVLDGETRGADAAVWRSADVPERTGGYRRIPPVLAVEVAGKYDTEAMLRDKAAWYLSHGTSAVWVLLPGEHRVLVLTSAGETSCGFDERLPAHPELPGLAPSVAELFAQLGTG